MSPRRNSSSVFLFSTHPKASFGSLVANMFLSNKRPKASFDSSTGSCCSSCQCESAKIDQANRVKSMIVQSNRQSNRSITWIYKNSQSASFTSKSSSNQSCQKAVRMVWIGCWSWFWLFGDKKKTHSHSTINYDVELPWRGNQRGSIESVDERCWWVNVAPDEVDEVMWCDRCWSWVYLRVHNCVNDQRLKGFIHFCEWSLSSMAQWEFPFHSKTKTAWSSDEDSRELESLDDSWEAGVNPNCDTITSNPSLWKIKEDKKKWRSGVSIPVPHAC
jgi:hypothetical protein